MKQPLRLAVLVSGNGMTLQNFIDRMVDGRLHACIVVVISNSATAYGLVRAENAGIRTAVIPHQDYPDVVSFNSAIFQECRHSQAELVALAGFLRLLRIPDDFAGQVMNIHPALLPEFGGKGYYGRRVHEAVLDAGAKESGCTVHFADNHYDHGPIILQRRVPVLPIDTPEMLAERVFQQECDAYPEAINLYAAGRLRIEGHQVEILPAT